VIDAGTSIEQGSSKGDVERESVEKKASFLTPVPGGVGPLTVACLFKNLFLINE
ncbi:bifunctional 5,10-methylenetetrahydrofolate dehydrogenase/5,10-methenyltetrahydrofolate cyclohydrolase, partial [Patescibacteria group bacterium]|nr:bifunctional 5,10-methylenetetrahydrofolate dehydrogenase/5,10-methenyltetrahydrofolate cyclohydrolase [Patescibacteria group bacterium]